MKTGRTTSSAHLLGALFLRAASTTEESQSQNEPILFILSGLIDPRTTSITPSVASDAVMMFPAPFRSKRK